MCHAVDHHGSWQLQELYCYHGLSGQIAVLDVLQDEIPFGFGVSFMWWFTSCNAYFEGS